MTVNNLVQRFMQTQSSDKSGSGMDAKSLAAGAALGGIAGFLANSATGRRLGRKALRHGRTVAGVGGLAMLGGAAFKALGMLGGFANGADGTEAAGSAPADTNLQTDPLLLLRSMIAAAYADGEMDSAERDKLFGQVHNTTLSSDERRLVMAELEAPKAIPDLVAACRCDEDRSAVYAAARLAIDVDTDLERSYLASLAGALQLPPQVVNEIDRELVA